MQPKTVENVGTGQYISVRETAQILGISEKKVMDLIDEQILEAYRIANQFLRLKRQEVMELVKSGDVVNESEEIPYSFGERVRDYFYFNDFYLVSTGIIMAFLYIIFFAAA